MSDPCSLRADGCAQCGAPTTESIVPTDGGTLAVALLCAACHDLAWRQFVWVKTWSLRFERWGAPHVIISAWWALCTWATTRRAKWRRNTGGAP